MYPRLLLPLPERHGVITTAYTPIKALIFTCCLGEKQEEGEDFEGYLFERG